MGVRVADETEEGNRPVLVAQTNEAIRLVERLRPLSLTEPKPGVYVLDMGQNVVGWIRARMTAEAGSKVTVQYAEMLNDDGTVYTENLRGAPQRDTVEFTESKTVEWHPRFTYHGFRYVSIEGLSEKPDVTDVTGEVFCSSSKETATFDTSNPMVDRLWQNIFWTQRANLMSSPTDCPQRDERLGWMGDILAFAQTAYFNMDMSGFFTKWLQDVRDAQADNGMYPDFAPHPYGKNDRFTGVPGWGDAGVVCAWVHYRNTGDKALLASHFGSMKRWVDWIASKNPDGVWAHERHNDYGDWLNGDTLVRDGWNATGSEMPKDAFATTMWYQSADMVSKAADVLGRKSEAREYRAMAEKVKAAFQKAFVTSDGKIKGDTQAGYAMALHLGLMPAGLEQAAFDHMVRGIESRDWHMTTGFHSTLPMMDVLSRHGRNDVAYRLLLNTTFPSWGYTIENGATTIWERWDGYVKGRGFQDPGMNSFNHWALGSVGEWMMKKVGGIAPGETGWATSVIAPTPGPGIEWSKSSYLSPRGPVSVSWRIEDGRFKLSVSVPPNTTSRVLLPGPDGAAVEVGPNKEARSHARKVGREGWATVYEVEAGDYTFSVPYGP